MAKYQDYATQKKYEQFKSQGMSDSDIDKSGIFMKGKPMDKPIDSQTIKAKTGNSFQRAKGIMSKAIAKYRSKPKPDTSDLDTKEKSLVASGKDPSEMAAMKRSIENRRRLGDN
jgi:hypothetical protein